MVKRFFCLTCRRSFSDATEDSDKNQKKRQINLLVYRFFSSGVSQRRMAPLLNVNIKTIARKLKFLGPLAKRALNLNNLVHPLCSIVEFDDLETFEHTKLKPVSVTLAIEYKTRRILGFEVSRMPAKGLIAALSRKKYGFRKDERPQGIKTLFKDIQPFIKPDALIKSDQNPGYPKPIKSFFPNCQHKAYKSRKACIVGQGELKEGRFDPLFTLNHSFAMLRANINRLFRRSWNTTKDPLRLEDHIALYCLYHNTVIIQKK